MSVKETILSVVKTRKFIVTATALLSAAGGAAGGYLVASKKLEQKYADISDREIREAKIFYASFAKPEDPETLAQKYDEDEDEELGAFEDGAIAAVEMIKEAADILEEQEYTPYNRPETIEETKQGVDVRQSIKKNIFDNAPAAETVTEPFDVQAEMDKREVGHPYIITKDDFFAHNDEDFEEYSFTYFDGDGVLADEQDSFGPEVDAAVGLENLRFGYGSESPTEVFVRNDTLRTQYVVVRSNGSYSKEVQGFDEDDQYVDKRPRKFRSDD